MKMNFSKVDFVHCGQVIRGSQAMWVVSPMAACPIGHIFYRNILLNHIEILYIFVHERLRRQRLAERMLVELRMWHPSCTICTALGNDLSTPWLTAMGFKQTPAGWFLEPLQVQAMAKAKGEESGGSGGSGGSANEGAR